MPDEGGIILFVERVFVPLLSLVWVFCPWATEGSANTGKHRLSFTEKSGSLRGFGRRARSFTVLQDE